MKYQKSIIGKVLKDIKREKITSIYSKKDRLIDSKTYSKLKSKKKCDNCHKKLHGKIPEIHHKISHELGGSNDESNLLALCKECHKKLDEQNEKIN